MANNKFSVLLVILTILGLTATIASSSSSSSSFSSSPEYQDVEIIDLTKDVPDEDDDDYDGVNGILSKVQKCDKDKQSPVILVPGLMASVLEGHLTGIPSNISLPHKSCKRTTKSWKTFWAKPTQFLPKNFDCLCSYLSMDIEPYSGATRNKEGVNLRVPRFGELYSVDRVVPKGVAKCFSDVYHRIIKHLKKAGFVEGETLFGAPYDWRRFPHTEWFDATSALIEAAVNSTGKRAIIVSHSMGGPYTYELLMSKSPAWRAKYIGHWIPISPVLSGTPLAIYAMLARSVPILPQYLSDIAAIATSVEEQYYLLPKAQYGSGNETFVKTNKRAYTQDDFPELLERLGVPHGPALVRKAQKFVDKTGLRHPGVRVSFLVSKGLPTVKGGKYLLDGNVGKTTPIPVFGDGDGVVTTTGLTQVAQKWMADPLMGNMTQMKVVKGLGVNHLSILYAKEVKKFIETYSCE